MIVTYSIPLWIRAEWWERKRDRWLNFWARLLWEAEKLGKDGNNENLLRQIRRKK